MSELVQWKEEYNTGCAEIDRQHQHLAELINQLYTAFGQGLASAKIISIIKELEKYTKEHFATEEELFEKYNYPRTEEHKAEHEQLTREVANFRRQVESSDDPLLAYHVMLTLKEWLMNHVLGSDMDYKDYLCKPSMN